MKQEEVIGTNDPMFQALVVGQAKIIKPGKLLDKISCGEESLDPVVLNLKRRIEKVEALLKAHLENHGETVIQNPQEKLFKPRKRHRTGYKE